MAIHHQPSSYIFRNIYFHSSLISFVQDRENPRSATFLHLRHPASYVTVPSSITRAAIACTAQESMNVSVDWEYMQQSSAFYGDASKKKKCLMILKSLDLKAHCTLHTSIGPLYSSRVVSVTRLYMFTLELPDSIMQRVSDCQTRVGYSVVVMVLLTKPCGK